MRSSKMSLKSKIFVFWYFLLEHLLGFNLVKISRRMGNWFFRNNILSDWKNNEKQRNYLLYMAISLNWYLWLPTHFAWLHHKCRPKCLFLFCLFGLIAATSSIACSFTLSAKRHFVFQRKTNWRGWSVIRDTMALIMIVLVPLYKCSYSKCGYTIKTLVSVGICYKILKHNTYIHS